MFTTAISSLSLCSLPTTTTQNKLDKAEEHFRMALAICSKSLGDTHPDTQGTAIGLWNVLQAKGGCESEMAALDAKHGI